MGEEQKLFLWLNYTKYYLICFGVTQCQSFSPIIIISTPVSLIWLHHTTVSSLSSSVFPQRKSWLTGRFPTQISRSCVVKYHFLTFVNHILCTCIEACCFYYGEVEWGLYFTVQQCVSWQLANDFTSQLWAAVVSLTVCCDALLQYLDFIVTLLF